LTDQFDFAQEKLPAGRSNFSYEKTSAPFFENFFLLLSTSGKKKKEVPQLCAIRGSHIKDSQTQRRTRSATHGNIFSRRSL